MGIAFASEQQRTAVVVVANSGENSVSVLSIDGFASLYRVVSSAKILAVPSPFAVLKCNGELVTSPASNSISFVDAAKNALIATIKVGSQPYSAVCSSTFVTPDVPISAFVSNYGDSSVSVVDVKTLAILRTISGIPGSRSLHGIALAGDGNLWVAGTEASLVTVVNPITGKIIAAIPVPAPTTVSSLPPLGESASVNNPGSVLVTGSQNGNLFNYKFDVKTLTLTRNEISVVTNPIVPGAAEEVYHSWYVGQHQPYTTFTLATSPLTNQVFLIQPQPSVPSNFSAANAASFSSASTAPGTIASLFVPTGLKQNFVSDSMLLPKTLGGITLSIGGSLSFDETALKWIYSPTGSIQAALMFAGPNQVNFQVPPGIAPGSGVAAQLLMPDGSQLLTRLNLMTAAPGIFSVLQNGRGQAAALNQDTTQNYGTNPAKRGSVIQIYATGGGETTPALLPGEPAPASGNPLVATNVQPTVTIGGVPARVLFSGMAPGYVGLWQINAEVPQLAAPGPAVPLTISAGGNTSNTVTIAVE